MCVQARACWVLRGAGLTCVFMHFFAGWLDVHPHWFTHTHWFTCPHLTCPSYPPLPSPPLPLLPPPVRPPPRCQACCIVLKVVKSRQPLLQAGKLLYRLSKEPGNDVSFRREGLLEPLLRTVHVLTASATKSSNPSSMHEVRRPGGEGKQ